jgi:hypothetical protein
MAGLDPAIHVDTQENCFKSMCWLNGVDARIKSGHDELDKKPIHLNKSAH